MNEGRASDCLVLEIRARPGAKKEGVEWDPWRKCWQVSVKAPPVEGEANVAILQLLAKLLEVSPSHLTLLAGERSKAKRLEVRGLSPELAKERLERGSGGPEQTRLTDGERGKRR